MSEPVLKAVEQAPKDDAKARSEDLPTWETPQMQDVSEEVMAQPYIRFT